MMNKGRVFFRADGHAKMGLGHVIRSLALADMLKDDFDCHFVIRNPLPTLKKQILAVCKTIIELPETNDDVAEATHLAEQVFQKNDIVVLDGYHFETKYQQQLKDAGYKIVCIDDIHTCHFVADVVINHAPELSKAAYSAEDYTEFCLGLDYALLRKPFLLAAQKQRVISTIETLFVCFGGADFNNLSYKSLVALSKPNHTTVKKVNIVLGGANVFAKEIHELKASTTTIDIQIHQNLSAQGMVDLMTASDLAIVPASSILYEIMAVKMPVISGYYVDNQVNIYHGFNKIGLIHGVGDFNEFENYARVIEEIAVSDLTAIIQRQQAHLSGSSKAKYLAVFNRLNTI